MLDMIAFRKEHKDNKIVTPGDIRSKLQALYEQMPETYDLLVRPRHAIFDKNPPDLLHPYADLARGTDLTPTEMRRLFANTWYNYLMSLEDEDYDTTSVSLLSRVPVGAYDAFLHAEIRDDASFVEWLKAPRPIKGIYRNYYDAIAKTFAEYRLAPYDSVYSYGTVDGYTVQQGSSVLESIKLEHPAIYNSYLTFFEVRGLNPAGILIQSIQDHINEGTPVDWRCAFGVRIFNALRRGKVEIEPEANQMTQQYLAHLRGLSDISATRVLEYYEYYTGLYDIRAVLDTCRGRDLPLQELEELYVKVNTWDVFIPLRYTRMYTAEELIELLPVEHRAEVGELYDCSDPRELAKYLTLYSFQQRLEWVKAHNCAVAVTAEDLSEYCGKPVNDITECRQELLEYALNNEPEAFIGAALISEDLREMCCYLLNGCSIPIVKTLHANLYPIAERMGGFNDSQIISYLRQHPANGMWYDKTLRCEVEKKYGRTVLNCER